MELPFDDAVSLEETGGVGRLIVHVAHVLYTSVKEGQSIVKLCGITSFQDEIVPQLRLEYRLIKNATVAIDGFQESWPNIIVHVDVSFISYDNDNGRCEVGDG